MCIYIRPITSNTNLVFGLLAPTIYMISIPDIWSILYARYISQNIIYFINLHRLR